MVRMDKRIVVGLVVVIALIGDVWMFMSRSAGPTSQLRGPDQAARDAADPLAANLTAAPSGAAAQRAEVTPAASNSSTAPSSAPAMSPDSALVKVLVIDKSTRKPMPDIQVMAHESKAQGPHAYAKDEGRSRGKLWDSLRSDSQGRAEVEVPSQTELEFQAYGDRTKAGSARTTVAPMTAGASTDIVLELPTGDDLQLWLKVVEEATDAPMSGVKVSIENFSSADKSAKTDAQGLVSFATSSWLNSSVHVTPADRCEMVLAAQAGHERVADAFVVRVPLAAKLRVHVVDGRGANVTGARVMLTMPGYNLAYPREDVSFSLISLADPHWEGLTDEAGLTTIAALPPRVPIQAGIGAPKKWTSPENITLDPGTTRDVEWKLTDGCDLHGIVLDQDKRPVVAREIWLRKAQRKQPMYFNSYDKGETRSATTDSNGRFRFAGVSPGAWWVGPSQPQYGEKIADDDVAALAQVVEIADGQTDVDVTLQVDRGLWIRGRVLDSKGEPAKMQSVSGYDTVSKLGAYNPRSTPAGGFALGPLMRGRYRLVASGMQDDADSEPADVDAGTQDVVLRLRPGAVVAGIVLDETGHGRDATLMVSQPGSKTFGTHSMTPLREGKFHFGGLLPGTYEMAARTSDGMVGVLPHVEVSLGGAGEHLVIHLHAAGRVRVRHEGPEKHANISVLSNGVPVGSDGVERGAAKEFAAPFGAVVVRAQYYEDDPRVAERSVDVKPGETVDVVFESGAH